MGADVCSMNVVDKEGGVNAFIEKIFTREGIGVVEAHQAVGSDHWLIVNGKNPESNPGKHLVLVMTERNGNDFVYKEIPEEHGPTALPPKEIMEKVLWPARTPYAKEFRARFVKNEIAKQKKQDLSYER